MTLKRYWQIMGFILLMIAACSTDGEFVYSGTDLAQTYAISTTPVTSTTYPSAEATSSSTKEIIDLVEIIQPDIEQRCPSNGDDHSIADLGLAPSTHLIVESLNENDQPVLLLIDSYGSNEHFFKGVDNGSQIIYYDTSPNKQWIAYSISHEGAQDELWIRTIDGSVQIPFPVDNMIADNSFIWANDDWLLRIKSPGYITITEFIDPFSSTFQIIEDTVLFQAIFAFRPNGQEVVYHSLSHFEWTDFQTGVSKDIFPWIDNIEDINMPWDIYLTWDEEGVSVAVLEDRYLVLRPRIPPSQLTGEGYPSYYVELPGTVETVRVAWWSLKYQLLAVTWGTEDYEDPYFQQQSYFLDTNTWSFFDYCLPSFPYTAWATFASYDERFLAWTGFSEEEGVFVLDIRTGNYAFIPGVEVVNWGEIPEEVEIPIPQ